MRGRQTLLVYARYDLTFPVDLSEELVQCVPRRRGIPHEVAVLRCGHYSTGKAPFKFVDGWVLTRFLKGAEHKLRVCQVQPDLGPVFLTLYADLQVFDISPSA